MNKESPNMSDETSSFVIEGNSNDAPPPAGEQPTQTVEAQTQEKPKGLDDDSTNQTGGNEQEAQATPPQAKAGEQKEEVPEVQSADDQGSAEEPDGKPSQPDDSTADTPKPKRSVQRRINKEIKRRAKAESRSSELEQEIAQLREQLENQTREPPKADDFDTLDEFKQAESEFKANNEADRESPPDQAGTPGKEDAPKFGPDTMVAVDIINDAIYNADGLPDDFHQVTTADTFFVTETMIRAISEADNPQGLFYSIAKNPEKALEICNMEPDEQSRAVTLFEAEQAKKAPAPAKPVKISKAPEPIKPASGDGAHQKTLNEMPFSEFEAERNRQERSKPRL